MLVLSSERAGRFNRQCSPMLGEHAVSEFLLNLKGIRNGAFTSRPWQGDESKEHAVPVSAADIPSPSKYASTRWIPLVSNRTKSRKVVNQV